MKNSFVAWVRGIVNYYPRALRDTLSKKAERFVTK